MARKRIHSDSKSNAKAEDGEVPAVREMTEEEVEQPQAKMAKWTNKQRVLVLAYRNLAYRDRHLMKDLVSLLPQSKTESKMRRSDSLFSANEMAEMKNCNKCLLFEGRKMRDLYMWMANVARGPSAKFQVENVHTTAELKMTGNCLTASRPLLSFHPDFSSPDKPHLHLLKELFVQTFGIPRGHPKSQPFFDRVYAFSVVDDKIWFRHYQVLPEEDGSLAEIGPRFVLNPIKIFDSSFSGQTLWENPKYVTPNAHRSLLKKMKAGKYARNVQSKAAYIASKPKDSTYKVDRTDDVFATLPSESDEGEENVEVAAPKPKKPAKKNPKARKKAKREALKAAE